MKFLVMSDLHLSKKPWQVRKALNMGKDADAVLLAVAGNHDYPEITAISLATGQRLPGTIWGDGNREAQFYKNRLEDPSKKD